MKRNPPATKIWTREQSELGRRAARSSVLLGLSATGTGLFQAWCVARILAAALAGSAHLALWPVLVGFAVAACLRAVLQAAGEIAGSNAGAAARTRLRHSALVSILGDGPRLLRGLHSAALTAIVVDRIEAIDGFFARYLPAASLMFAAPLLVLVAAAVVQPFAGAVLLACGLAVPLMQAGFGIGAALAARQQFQALSRLQTRFVDRMRGIATIVLAGRTQDEAARLAATAGELRMRTMRVLRIAFLASAGLDCAMAVALLAIALHDGAFWLHPDGARIPLSHALFALLVVPEFFAPFRSFALAYQDRAQAASTAEEFARLPQPAAALPSALVAMPATGAAASALGSGKAVKVELQDVHFSWNGKREAALRGISLHIEAGETIIVTGASGAGKSTLIELLLGFIRPDSGRVLIDGADVAGLQAAELSNLVAWIGQKPLLFAGSLRDNIVFARPDASESALQQAISIAALEQTIADLPDGLDTRIGEAGYGLSGGQGQRLAIARAVLREAPLLLLDEPTAHLDPATERAVFESLRRLAVGRTVLMASHSRAAMLLGGRRVEIANGKLMTEQSCVA